MARVRVNGIIRSDKIALPPSESPIVNHCIDSMGRGMGLRQAYELRNLAAREALEISMLKPPKHSQARLQRAKAIASLILAWETASDRVRILRGLPLPGSRRPAPQGRSLRNAKPIPLTEWGQKLIEVQAEQTEGTARAEASGAENRPDPENAVKPKV